MDNIREALAHHRAALMALGITYDGTLCVSEGSVTYGNAFRIYRTHVTVIDPATNEPRTSTGHYSPPVGDDFLGMTKRDAYNNLTARTRVLWDVKRETSAR
jgi:hypothetical protein